MLYASHPDNLDAALGSAVGSPEHGAQAIIRFGRVVHRLAVLLSLGAALVGCNGILEIRDPVDEDPTDVDSGSSAAPAPSATGGGTGGAPAALEGGAAGAAGGSVPRDAAAAGDVTPLGTAMGSVAFSDANGTNANTTPFASTSGDANRTSVGDADPVTRISLTSFFDGIQRLVVLHLHGAIVPATIALDDANYLEYYDVNTGNGWNSTKAVSPGGSVVIADVNGTAFSFTLKGVKMGPSLSGNGYFTLEGKGEANPH